MAGRTNTLNLGPGLRLEADYLAGRSLALLGKRGAGKTYTCRVLVEELHQAQVQTVIIDPMGVFWGLRSSADGRKEGLPIPVFGGTHGDVPLEPSAGRLMADIAVHEGLSMILDLSSFTSRTQERSFAADFLDRLYRTNQHLVHLLIDEADLFAPQKPRPQDAPLLAITENIVRRGRNKGLGCTLASQRAAVINKDVLTQVDVLAAMRVTAPQDRAAIREWVQGQGDEDHWSKISASLPSLADGEAWWWVPEQHLLERVQGRRTRTFDSSPTRQRGATARSPRTFADVDLSSISERISATVERAKAEDPAQLRRQVAKLEAENARLAANREPERVEVPVVPAATIRALATAREEANTFITQLEDLATQIHQLRDVSSRFDGLLDAATNEQPVATAPRIADPPASPSPRAQPVIASASMPPSEPGAEPTDVTPARQRLINALAELKSIGITAAPKTQLALWAGVSPKSSGYQNNLGGLRTQGLIDYPSPGLVALTASGQGQVTELTVPGSDGELHARVRELLTPARWRILEPLIAAHPDVLGREELAAAAGVSSASSGYQNNLGGLRSLGLIDYPRTGAVVATDVLFPYISSERR